ncbi:MAG: hypothetical protein HY820_36555 [Acidobacteria bacterium]|nr:hypothetical protein [Acidobacteriota bacterium]
MTETFTSLAGMANGRSSHGAVLLGNGRVLIVGGYQSGLGPEAEIFDPATQTWTSTSPRLHGADVTLATLPNGKVLIAAGTYTSAVDLFDPGTGTWQAMNSLVYVRHTATASTLPSGKVLIAGGNDGYTASYTAEIYDVNANNGAGGTRQPDRGEVGCIRLLASPMVTC